MKSLNVITAVCFIILTLTGCVSRPIIKKQSVPEMQESPAVPVQEKAQLEEAQNAVLQQTKETAQVTYIQKTDIPEKLKVGAKAKYRMDWLRIPVGYVTFEVTGEEKVNGRDVYVLVLKAQSNKWASKIYRIDDTYTSYVDKETLLPARYDVNRHEGNYRKNAVTYFDREKGIAHFENFKDGSKKTYTIPGDVLDPVSCIVKVWAIDLRLGDSFVFNVANNEQVYKVYTYVQKKQVISVKGLGDFEAYYIAPYAMLNGELVRKGTVSGYVQTGSKKELLFAEGRASIFSKMSATLIETDM